MASKPSQVKVQWASHCALPVKVLLLCSSISISCSGVPDSLRPHGLPPTRLLCPWDFPGKDTGVGCHFLLQEIFPTQGSNLGLLHCRQILYWLSYRPQNQQTPNWWRCEDKFWKLVIGVSVKVATPAFMASFSTFTLDCQRQSPLLAAVFYDCFTTMHGVVSELVPHWIFNRPPQFSRRSSVPA